jgi:hypothetical protein
MGKKRVSTLSLCLFPSVKETSIVRKTTRINSYVESATQQSYSYGLVGACVHTKTKFYLSRFNINKPIPDEQFIFSSSWLPSPSFELRTVAGYSAENNFLPFVIAVRHSVTCHTL